MRTPDGVHFVFPANIADYSAPTVVEGGEYLAPALLPLWEQLGHEEEAKTHGASVDRGPLPNAFLSPQ